MIKGPAQACHSSTNIGEAAAAAIGDEIVEEQEEVEDDKQQPFLLHSSLQPVGSSTSLMTWFKSISIYKNKQMLVVES